MSFESQYNQFILSNEKTLFFVSNKYRKFLRSLIEKEDFYFLAFDNNGNIVGALPCFINRNKEYGNLLNSGPFYGSNGGIIEFENNSKVRIALINEFYNFAKQNNCVATTIISSPLDPMEEFYEQVTCYTYQDLRIGQLTPFPQYTEEIDDVLMKMIHQKTRNMVRKAQKLKITVHNEQSNEYMNFLISTHQENMMVIGAKAKPEGFFRLIQEYFINDSDYKIYVAKKDGQLIAALLLFYFNKTVEYFVPVVKAEYRNSQPLSLLIFEAMKDCISKGYKWWNWGGTRATLNGVYNFKKRWGTKDKPYYFYTKIFNATVLKKTKEQLMEAYPYFYVAPFDKLSG